MVAPADQGCLLLFFYQAEDGIRDYKVTGVHVCSSDLDVSQAVQQSLVIFLAVGTPPKPDGSPDMSFVEEIGRASCRVTVGGSEAARPVLSDTQKDSGIAIMAQALQGSLSTKRYGEVAR